MLLVIRAQTAIQRTTLRRLDLCVPRKPRRQSRIVTIKPTPIAADEVLAKAMLRTTFAKINAFAFSDYFCLNDPEAIRTKTLRTAQKGIRRNGFSVCHKLFIGT